MRRLAAALSLLILTVLAPASDGLATPVLGDPFRDAHYAGYGIPILAYGDPAYSAVYSASSDRLKIKSVVAGADITHWDDVEGPYFDSRLDIEAGIDASGNVVDAGYLIWYGDFGSGSEVLATAHLIDLGFGGSHYSEDGNAWHSLRLLFDIDYLSPLVPGKSPFLGLWLEHGFGSMPDRALFEDSPFFEDWSCISNGDGNRCTEPYSTSAFSGLSVTEPASGLVLLLASAGLYLRRRLDACLITSRYSVPR